MIFILHVLCFEYQVQKQLALKDEQITISQNKIKIQKEEIERRQYIENKVQTYVKTLCGQNERLKDFIKKEAPDTDKVNKFLENLQYENGATGTEGEEEEEEYDEEQEGEDEL